MAWSWRGASLRERPRDVKESHIVFGSRRVDHGAVEFEVKEPSHEFRTIHLAVAVLGIREVDSASAWATQAWRNDKISYL